MTNSNPFRHLTNRHLRRLARKYANDIREASRVYHEEALIESYGALEKVNEEIDAREERWRVDPEIAKIDALQGM